MPKNLRWLSTTSRRASPDMPTIEQIKNDVKRLSKNDREALLDWLTDLLEDELELTDEFKAKIEQGKADIAAGLVRIVHPQFR